MVNVNVEGVDCVAVLTKCDVQLHQHSDKTDNCDHTNTGKDSDHMVQNALFQNSRGGALKTVDGFGDYSAGTAPCICMDGPSGGTGEHGKKTRDQEAFAECPV